MVQAKTSWARLSEIAAAAGACLIILAAGLSFDLASSSRIRNGAAASVFQQSFKLVAAVLSGLAITIAYRYRRPDTAASRMLDQTQILLCVVAALMTIVIGDSLARALGLLGGASIVRFRTPVKNPQNAAILFALLGLGAACGLGAFVIAGAGTAFLCLLLAAMAHTGEPGTRVMLVELVSEAREFPSRHVQRVFAEYGFAFETRELLQSSEAAVTYSVTVDTRTSLNDVSGRLLNSGAGIKSVAWQASKKDGGACGL